MNLNKSFMIIVTASTLGFAFLHPKEKHEHTHVEFVAENIQQAGCNVYRLLNGGKTVYTGIATLATELKLG